MKVESLIKPNRLEFQIVPNGNIEVLLRDNIKEEIKEESREEGKINSTTIYSFDEYRIVTRNRDNIKEDIENNFDTWINNAKNNEVENLSKSIRDKRDKLLSETDQLFLIDHMGLNTPEPAPMTMSINENPNGNIDRWIPFLESLAAMLSSDWSKYRQDLRDIPQQSGFPYDIVWPESPKSK